MSVSSELAGTAMPGDTAEGSVGTSEIQAVKSVEDNAKALRFQGDAYRTGKTDGVAQDLSRALSLYKEAAELGDAVAVYFLGVFHEHGMGMEKKELRQAVAFYMQAADLGVSLAKYRVGCLYRRGFKDEDGTELVPVNHEKACKLFQAAGDKGIVDAQFAYGYMREKGFGCRKSMKEAQRIYEIACRAEHPDALLRLGLIMRDWWWHRSMMQGNQMMVDKSNERVAQLFELSAKKGNKEAVANLAFAYQNGTGVPQDFNKARAMYESVAGQGVAIADFQLGILYLHGYGVPIDLEKSFKYFETAAQKQYPLALFQLGWMYHRGTGVEQDFSKAAEYYRKAMATGDWVAYVCYYWMMYGPLRRPAPYVGLLFILLLPIAAAIWLAQTNAPRP